MESKNKIKDPNPIQKGAHEQIEAEERKDESDINHLKSKSES